MKLLLAFFLAVPLFWTGSLSASFTREANAMLLKVSNERPDTIDDPQFQQIASISKDSLEISHRRPKRGIAIALTVLLGPLGGHRLYLGTEPKVPVLYTVTLGGGLGILPLIDLVQLIVTRDFEKFFNKKKVFMWIDEKDPGGK